MTNPARLAALRAQLAALTAELDDLTNDDTPTGSAAEGGVEVHNATFEEKGLVGKPHQETVEDALAYIRKRHGRTRSEQLAEQGQDGDRTRPSAIGHTTAADGVAAARARRRHGGGNAA